MGGYCFRCVERHHDGSCRFVPTAFPHPEAHCFLKPSRFKSKELGGKVIGPHQDTDPAPKTGIISTPLPVDENPMSLVVRDGKKFYLDQEGNCFSADEKLKPLGHISDFEEPIPSKEEMDEAIERLKRTLAKEFTHGRQKQIQQDEPEKV